MGEEDKEGFPTETLRSRVVGCGDTVSLNATNQTDWLEELVLLFLSKVLSTKLSV